MDRYEIHRPEGIDALKIHAREEPRPGPFELLLDMKAWSLNYRDLAMPRGGYPGNEKVRTEPPLVPLSDGAGVVLEVGAGVTRFSPGDRVMTSFFQDWPSGALDARSKATALGGAIDGVLAERVVLREGGCVRMPASLDFVEAATLPCAGVTAWASLAAAQTRPGQTVLLLGTGGVSLFGLQLARGFGARAYVTSSSDQKLAKVAELGASTGINYSNLPEWQERVLELTDGVGVDHVLEVGGAGTLERSLASTRVGGTVSLIGVLTGVPDNNPSVMDALFRGITLRGIYVGSRQALEDLARAVDTLSIRPVVDRVFDFDDVPAAYRYLKSKQHVGKVAIRSR